jgi:hypothetical protein
MEFVHNWPLWIGVLCFKILVLYDCVEKFYVIVRECFDRFDRFVPFYYSADSEKRQHWFDKELRNLDNIRTKSPKHMKGVYVRDNSQEDFYWDGGFEGSSTVSLIQLEEETVEQGILSLKWRTGFRSMWFIQTTRSGWRLFV